MVFIGDMFVIGDKLNAFLRGMVLMDWIYGAKIENINIFFERARAIWHAILKLCMTSSK